jgi:hypothetical protein
MGTRTLNLWPFGAIAQPTTSGLTFMRFSQSKLWVEAVGSLLRGSFLEKKGQNAMKQIVWIIISAFVTAIVLIGSLTAMTDSHQGPPHGHTAVTHSASSH